MVSLLQEAGKIDKMNDIERLQNVTGLKLNTKQFIHKKQNVELLKIMC